MDRRTFLRMSASSVVLAAAPPLVTNGAELIEAPVALSGDLASDERYWSAIREDFPIVHELIYMNNGTMGPSPYDVTKRVTDRIAYVDRTGDYNGDYEGVRKAIASLLHAEDESRIAFTHNVSESISIVASGLKLKRGDEVILTDQEHAGNAIPWLARAKRDGIVIKFVTLAADTNEVLARFQKAVTPRTRVIAVPHVTCTNGQVLPIKELSAMAHKAGAWLMADGAHPPGMMQVDVRDLGVDAYASCGHKWLCGPKGVGFLYITEAMQNEVAPTWTGAEADKHWDYTGDLQWLPSASRFDFATQNFALFDGLHAAIDHFNRIGIADIEARVQFLTRRLRECMSDTLAGQYDMLTPTDSVTGLTTVRFRNMEYHAFANKLLSEHKIRTRVVPESNLNANRFSVHIYTSAGDIDSFCQSAKAVLGI